MKGFTLLLLLLLTRHAYCQDKEAYAVTRIPAALKENADAIIRNYETVIEIVKPGKAKISEKLVVTILNEKGRRWGTCYDFYDGFSKIPLIEGAIYDAEGKLIRKSQSSEVVDRSYVDESSIAGDARIKGIDMVFDHFPYTVEFNKEKVLDGYLALPSWDPLEKFNTSLETASLTVLHPEDVAMKYMAKNVANPEPGILKNKNIESLSWKVEQLPAIKFEPFSPEAGSIFPVVMVNTVHIKLDGYSGACDTWEHFGKFIYDLNKGRSKFKDEKIPGELVSVLHADPHSAAEKLYTYLQDHTRYVSIQLGIGGWQSFDADYVNKYKVGDCKALTTYMKALLSEAGIPSSQVLVNAGDPEGRLWPDFPGNYFNHVVLMVPFQDDTTWLECTSPYCPFGYMGTPTEGRIGLLLSDSSSRLVNLPARTTGSVSIVSEVSFNENLSATAHSMVKAGNERAEKLWPLIHNGSEDDLKEWLHDLFRKGASKIDSLQAEKDNRSQTLTSISGRIELPGMLSKAGKNFLLEVNTFSGFNILPENVSARKLPVCNKRSLVFSDSTVYHLPKGMVTNLAACTPVEINSDFGSCHASLAYSKESNTLVFKRMFRLFPFSFPPERYKDFRDFLSAVYLSDRKVVVLTAE